MRRGNDPTFALDASGRLFCIATGSDACTEHECGSAELMSKLVADPIGTAEDVGLRRQIRRGLAPAPMPDLMSARRIRRNLDQIVYEERVVDGESMAAVAFTPNGLPEPFDNPFLQEELRFWTLHEPSDVVGAWSWDCFGYKVRGQEKVEQLREFARALKGGEGIFAGTFVKEIGRKRLSGVVIAIEPLLLPVHEAAMLEAQRQFEANVALYEGSRINQLRALASKNLGSRFIHIWPVWKGGVGGPVGYTVNAGSGLKIQSYQTYGFDELKAWLETGGKYSIHPPQPVDAN